MTFTDLVPGDVVFVDANIFVYHFAPDPVLQVSVDLAGFFVILS